VSARLAAAFLAIAAAAAPAPSAQDEDARVRAGIEAALRYPTIHSSLGPLETPLPLDVADFLLDHPDASAWLVRKRRLAPYRITMIGPNRSLADDGAGARGDITLAERGTGRRVYYGEGTYRTRIFPTVHAGAVITMLIEPVRRPGCRESVRTTFAVDVRLRNWALAGLVKALRPFLRDTVIRKFSKAFLVAHQIGELIDQDPAGVFAELASCPLLREPDRAALRALEAGIRGGPPSCPPPR
jgi:hypothetical protein